MDASLLELICCPQTHQALTPLTPDKLAEVNRRISLGEINTVNGIVVRTPLPAGLVREDGSVIYPISNGIPLLVPEEGILLG
jgi:uncharacterized protein YbaR (Trm112 family)